MGIGWLLRSAVATLRRVAPLAMVRTSYNMENDRGLQARAMGGREILLTFKTTEERDESYKSAWAEQWFDRIKPWQGESTSRERFVWISCYGIPFNAWRAETFQCIGELWGYFIKTGEETMRDSSFAKGRVLIATESQFEIRGLVMMEVQGRVYEVRMEEESSFSEPDEAMEEVQRSKGEGLKEKSIRGPWVEGAGESGMGRPEVEDDDMDNKLAQPTNGSGVIRCKSRLVSSKLTGKEGCGLVQEHRGKPRNVSSSLIGREGHGLVKEQVQGSRQKELLQHLMF